MCNGGDIVQKKTVSPIYGDDNEGMKHKKAKPCEIFTIKEEEQRIKKEQEDFIWIREMTNEIVNQVAVDLDSVETESSAPEDRKETSNPERMDGKEQGKENTAAISPEVTKQKTTSDICTKDKLDTEEREGKDESDINTKRNEDTHETKELNIEKEIAKDDKMTRW